MAQVAFITGGSRGIGFGIAEHLADEGFNLAINGVRPEEQVKDAVDQLKAKKVDVIYCQGDVSEREARNKMLDQINDHYGRLDVLVNNAGISPKERKDILEASEESYDQVMDTNLKSAYFLTQAVANWMIKQKEKNNAFKGCIINVSSISATVVSLNRGEYCVAKAGMSMATQLFAARLGEFDIPVYEVRPGLTKTDMTSAVVDKYTRLIEEGITVQKRWGYPEDVGKAVASFARGDFPYATGQYITIDGGLTIPRL